MEKVLGKGINTGYLNTEKVGTLGGRQGDKIFKSMQHDAHHGETNKSTGGGEVWAWIEVDMRYRGCGFGQVAR